MAGIFTAYNVADFDGGNYSTAKYFCSCLLTIKVLFKIGSYFSNSINSNDNIKHYYTLAILLSSDSPGHKDQENV